MSCSCSPGHEAFFDEELARKDARRYRRRGIDRAARRLVRFLVERGIEGRTVLEIGGGLGGVERRLWAENLSFRLRGIEFRSFVHPPETIHAAAFAAGLRRVLEHKGPIWHVAAFERAV